MIDLYYEIYHNPSHKIISWMPSLNDIMADNFELIFNGLRSDFGNRIRQEVGVEIIKTKL